GGGDIGIVLKKLRRHTFVDVILLRQLQRDTHHLQAKQAHPAGGVGLLQHDAVAEMDATIDDRDVVEAEETAFKNVVALAIDLVDPPREMDEQFVETAFEERSIRLTGANAIHVVDAPHSPRVNRRIQVGELPFISGYLAIGMLEL